MGSFQGQHHPASRRAIYDLALETGDSLSLTHLGGGRVFVDRKFLHRNGDKIPTSGCSDGVGVFNLSAMPTTCSFF